VPGAQAIDDKQAAWVNRSKRRGLVWYFGGRPLVNYWFHDGLTTRGAWMSAPCALSDEFVAALPSKD
jgi:hypothetical protein